MDVDQTAICVGTQKDSDDVTEFTISDLIRIAPREPKDAPENAATVSIVHKFGTTSFKVINTNCSKLLHISKSLLTGRHSAIKRYSV